MKLLDFLLNLVFPRRATCMGCGSMLGCDRDDLCEDCRETLAKNWVGAHPVPKNLNLDGAAFAYAYRGPAGSMVRHLKYRGVRLLADQMGRDLSRAVQYLQLEDEILVTAVPMHPKREQKRGFNHAALLARETARHQNLSYQDLLYRTRNAQQQARLSSDERRKNLHGAFAVRPECLDLVRKYDVLLIDDVLTTGATAAACARALKDAGANRVYFAAYAYGERKQHG